MLEDDLNWVLEKYGAIKWNEFTLAPWRLKLAWRCLLKKDATQIRHSAQPLRNNCFEIDNWLNNIKSAGKINFPYVCNKNQKMHIYLINDLIQI